jgi:hypothetical protein
MTSMLLSSRGSWAALLAVVASFGVPSATSAQTPVGFVGEQQYYQPIHQNLPPGVAAYAAGIQGKATPPYFQPVRVDLPSQGKVTVFHGPTFTPYEVESGRPFAFLVGHVYRIRIAGMPEYPGIDLYPTVEVLDRLHPPPGQELEFPIPLQFTPEEINAALDGRLVTKVVFLEQPQLAPPRDQEFPIPTVEFLSSVNILAEADRAGRPMAILRLGSRTPWAGGAEEGFFGPGAPVYIPAPIPAAKAIETPMETQSTQPNPNAILP